MRIGLFGGTFDPVHYGHLRLAEEARETANLECVLFVPARVSPFRLHESRTAPAHRLQMLLLATADNDAFEVSAAEIQRGDISYTVDTVLALRQQYPEAQLSLILGADALQGFLQWNRPEIIVQECCLLVGVRPPYDLEATLAGLPEAIRQRVQLVAMTPMDISASDIRLRVRTQRSIRYLTPPHVIEYIQQHRLYREP
jgi:nicotinate-nucleotide adenylyltransferase